MASRQRESKDGLARNNVMARSQPCRAEGDSAAGALVGDGTFFGVGNRIFDAEAHQLLQERVTTLDVDAGLQCPCTRWPLHLARASSSSVPGRPWCVPHLELDARRQMQQLDRWPRRRWRAHRAARVDEHAPTPRPAPWPPCRRLNERRASGGIVQALSRYALLRAGPGPRARPGMPREPSARRQRGRRFPRLATASAATMARVIGRKRYPVALTVATAPKSSKLFFASTSGSGNPCLFAVIGAAPAPAIAWPLPSVLIKVSDRRVALGAAFSSQC